MDVIIQKTLQDPLSLGCAEPALPEREPRACGLRYQVVPFNRTGCIQDVAGGRFAAPTIHLFRYTKNCQLSIVNCQFRKICHLSTVH